MSRKSNFYNGYLLGIICIIFLSQVLCYFNFNINTKHGDFLKFNTNDLSTSVFLEWNKSIELSGESHGRSIAIDNQNNIYVVGEIFNSSKNAYDILIIKYNALGDLEWNKTWGGDSDDKANAVAIDVLNNVYIAGETKSFGNGSSDVCLIKYDNSGNLDWNNTWGKELMDSGLDLALNGDDIFLIGYTESYDVYGDILLLKYNSSGKLELNTTFGGLDSDCGNAIVIDSNEDIYITGYTSSFGAESSDLILIKCEQNGNHLWNITWGGDLPDVGNDLILDLSNNITICGTTQNYGAGNTDVVLLNVNNSGILQWNFTYGTSNHDIGNSLDQDSNRNIFIAGYSNDDVLLLKINQSGSKKWMKTWGDNGIDTCNSITIDSFNNIFLTGKQENDLSKFNIFLWKFSPEPDLFSLSSNAGNPDLDGNIIFSWSESLDAENYCLYQANIPISEINGSVTELVKGNTNQTFSISNLGEGIYYFQVIAFNTYGNTSSNCLQVRVQFPPSEFELYNISQLPNTNGIVNLSWSESEGVNNYSVYVHDSPIQSIYTDGSLVAEGIKTTFYLVKNLTNGDYYYAVLANNAAGVKLSNSICVNVRRAPFSFELTTDANNPDEDGRFELIWTHSEYAQYYIVIFNNDSGTEIPQNIVLCNFTPEFQWSMYHYQINGWNSGRYEFKIEAHNEYGSCQTTCVEVVVSIPQYNLSQGDDTNKIPEFLIQQIILYLILIGALAGLIILYIKRR